MSLSPENELVIRKAVADRLGGISAIGYVLPAPIYFNDKSDFLNQISGLNLATQKAIEMKSVRFCALYPLQFSESESVNLIYEIYLFAESNSERNDESGTPDVFLKRLLKRHSEFTADWLNIRNEFEDAQTLAGLPDYSVKRTNAIEQTEFINNNAVCDFVPGLRGYSVKMRLTVNLLAINDC